MDRRSFRDDGSLPGRFFREFSRDLRGMPYQSRLHELMAGFVIPLVERSKGRRVERFTHIFSFKRGEHARAALTRLL